MKRLILACIAATALVAQAPSKVFPYPYAQEDLPNGLRLVTIPTEFPNIVSVYIVVQTGSRNEVEPGLTGFAHLFEHMMFRGTEKMPPAKYSDALSRMGAASNASTSEDYTYYYTTFSKEDLPAVLAMEADRFQHLKYSESEFKTETLAVLGEFNQNASSPFSKLREVLLDTAFHRSTYKHTVIGYLKDIQDMPKHYEYSRTFFERYYRPEYTTLLVVGDVKPKPVRELVDKFWGGWERGDYQPSIPAEPAQEAPRSAHVDWPNPTLPLLTLGFKGPAYDDSTRESAALDVLAFLAFSPNSDLYQQLVVQDQTADLLTGGIQDHVDASLFQVVARIKRREEVERVRDRILETIRAYQEKAVDTARLESVRKYLRYRLALRLDSSDAIAGVLVNYIGLRRTPATLNKLFEQYAQVTPEDVRAAAVKYLVESRRTLVTLAGPPAATGAAR